MKLVTSTYQRLLVNLYTASLTSGIAVYLLKPGLKPRPRNVLKISKQIRYLQSYHEKDISKSESRTTTCLMTVYKTSTLLHAY